MSTPHQTRVLPGAGGATGPEVVICLDTSGSMDLKGWRPPAAPGERRKAKPLSRLAGAKRAVRAYLDPLRPTEARVGLVAFNQTGRELCPLLPVRTHYDRLCTQLDSLGARGTTSFNAGLRAATETFGGYAPSTWIDWLRSWFAVRLPPRGAAGRELIFLSDGHHNGGPGVLRRAHALQRAGVRLSTIGIGTSPDEVDEELLRAMASVVDGAPAYRFIDDVNTLAQHYRDLAQALVMRRPPDRR